VIVVLTLAGVDQAPYSWPPCTTEGLAWHATGHQIHTLDAPERQRIEKLTGFAEISTPPDARQIGLMRPNRPLFGIRADQHVEARPREPQ
jgi:hypothetical protein